MANENYHPGIYCESRSTKRTASIILSSRQISLSNLTGFENKQIKKKKQKQKQNQYKHFIDGKDDNDQKSEQQFDDNQLDDDDDYEYDDIDDDTFSINSQQSFFFHPANYFAQTKNKHKSIGTESVVSIAATVDELECLPNMDELLHYSKEKELGNGTDSNVYEVVDRRDRSHVAMKLTKRKSGRYRTEIHLLHQLRTCPFIVSLLKVLEDENVYVLILEQAPMTLETLLHERCVENAMQEGVSKDIMSNLLKGIRAIHNLGFVHKDIKPENVLIFADRIHRKLLAKIADFGFATRAKPAIEMVNNGNVPQQILSEFVERVGDKCGTPGFWSPELVAGVVELNGAFKLDVFSAGVCLYRMLCNEMPFGLFETWDIKEQHGKLTKMKPNFQIISWIKVKSKKKNNKINYIRNISQNSSLSHNALNLLRGMLRIRPKKRLSVTQCLNCEWF